MPSGISHMLLSCNLPVDDDSTYRYKKLYNTRYFQIGSIAPDLPYGAIADNNFLENEDRVANLFHFTEVNQSYCQMLCTALGGDPFFNNTIDEFYTSDYFSKPLRMM